MTRSCYEDWMQHRVGESIQESHMNKNEIELERKKSIVSYNYINQFKKKIIKETFC